MELVGRVADSAGVALLVIADKTEEISGGLCDEPASGMQNGKRSLGLFLLLIKRDIILIYLRSIFCFALFGNLILGICFFTV